MRYEINPPVRSVGAAVLGPSIQQPPAHPSSTARPLVLTYDGADPPHLDLYTNAATRYEDAVLLFPAPLPTGYFKTRRGTQRLAYSVLCLFYLSQCGRVSPGVRVRFVCLLLQRISSSAHT